MSERVRGMKKNKNKVGVDNADRKVKSNDLFNNTYDTMPRQNYTLTI